MARLPGKLRRIRWTLLLALLMSVYAVPSYSQSNAANSISAEPKPEVSQSTQESKQPLAVDPRAGLSPSASPEDLRQAQLEADTKKLYQLAAELRAEVARTYKESLSLSVIKKAEEVEKLAKSLRVRMSKEAAIARH